MPNYRGSTCPYCSRTFRNAGPFDNHLRTSHPIGFYKRVSRQKRSQNPDKGQPYSSKSQFESSSYLETNDFPYSLSPAEAEANLSSDSDTESEFDDLSDEPEDSPETRREIYKNSGRSYGNILGEEESIRDLLQNPWSPFRNASEFKLARFFVEANVSWDNIENFMKALLASPEVQFTSSFTLHTLLNNMDNSLGPESWNQASVNLSGMDVPFYYRDPVDCVKYLIRQRAYQSDMVYSPERLYEGDERQYGELHTADWWWDTQVCTGSRSFEKGFLKLTKG